MGTVSALVVVGCTVKNGSTPSNRAASSSVFMRHLIKLQEVIKQIGSHTCYFGENSNLLKNF